MIKKTNSKGLSHEQVKIILANSDLNCIESKPGLFESKNNIHFIIKKNGTSIKLKVKAKEFRFSRVDPGWVYWGPVIAYSFLHSAFEIGPIVLLGLFCFTYLVNFSMRNSDFKVTVIDLAELLNREDMKQTV
jgi:hypothetical protein